PSETGRAAPVPAHQGINSLAAQALSARAMDTLPPNIIAPACASPDRPTVCGPQTTLASALPNPPAPARWPRRDTPAAQNAWPAQAAPSRSTDHETGFL